VNLGVLPGTGGTQRLARLLGNAKAIECMATGRTFDFDEAQAQGLVNHVFSSEHFWPDVVTYAKQFCPPHKASHAVGLMKRAVVTGSEVGLAEGLGIERELQQRLFTSEDAKEGLAAYVEKRQPQFKGR
jgi:enoyl-CoA hydratase